VSALNRVPDLLLTSFLQFIDNFVAGPATIHFLKTASILLWLAIFPVPLAAQSPLFLPASGSPFPLSSSPEQTEESITLAARDDVHRIPRSRIRAIESQAASLMPERLLNALTDDEIRDLLAFLDRGIGSAGGTQGTER
jgi:hypothetical protein